MFFLWINVRTCDTIVLDSIVIEYLFGREAVFLMAYEDVDSYTTFDISTTGEYTYDKENEETHRFNN